jgi:hypothetical protein
MAGRGSLRDSVAVREQVRAALLADNPGRLAAETGCGVVPAGVPLRA